ncbi:hypothetical protein DVH24_004789 [Malus domestica]|uniref:Uncharacterized protein n=1 Tax=Malus domestica TaxID=3750 RepID=A0A498IFH2_MALDO|nr:hypothetical protein DVH24_004789 [Malus domestica]
MEFCTVTTRFPTRRVVSFDGTPSVGLVSTTDHSVEWKIVMGGRALTRSIEATFPGKVQFAPWKPQKSPTTSSAFGSIADEGSDIETDGNNTNMANVVEFLTEKMSKDLHPADLEEPFCWHAYNYAKVSVYPTVKAPVEFSTQVGFSLEFSIFKLDKLLLALTVHIAEKLLENVFRHHCAHRI